MHAAMSPYGRQNAKHPYRYVLTPIAIVQCLSVRLSGRLFVTRHAGLLKPLNAISMDYNTVKVDYLSVNEL